MEGINIKGISITLYEISSTGTDEFNHPILIETPVTVDNVLVAPVSDQEVLDTINLTGRKAIYQLAIPKGDTHDWENRKIEFFGSSFRAIGKPTQGIDSLIPLGWNKKVKVESIV